MLATVGIITLVVLVVVYGSRRKNESGSSIYETRINPSNPAIIWNVRRGLHIRMSAPATAEMIEPIRIALNRIAAQRGCSSSDLVSEVPQELIREAIRDEFIARGVEPCARLEVIWTHGPMHLTSS